MQNKLDWLRAKIKEYYEFRNTNTTVTNTSGVSIRDTWTEPEDWYVSEKDAFSTLTNDFIVWMIKDYE